ncbi:radical SAM protein [Avibacterium paragallinarum]|uniref:Pyruvate formate-lyase 1-activating enzyme n=1 Tax=Avibacterium paragallinarum TaxID=728 RepID=A0A380Z220_AVIPA|nr:Pyruvate formate-lyase 1-activating enzyme [Avibacterium paragallinarum]
MQVLPQPHTWDLHGGKEISVEDLMKEVVSYRHFMNASGGGVTASGGEAVLQAEFVRDWFRACKKEGINTCLDTNGFVRHYDEVIDELLEVTDLVLLDLKELNDRVHQNLIGVPNKLPLNLPDICKNAINVFGFATLLYQAGRTVMKTCICSGNLFKI